MFFIPDADYFKDFNMMLNDNIIDCFLDGSSNIIESNLKDINIKYTEIVPIEKQEKLNKNKILDYNLNYNGSYIIRNVKSNKINRNCKNTRDNPVTQINDDIRPARFKRNNLSKQK